MSFFFSFLWSSGNLIKEKPSVNFWGVSGDILNISQTSRKKTHCLMFILTEIASFGPGCRIQGFVKKMATGTALLQLCAQAGATWCELCQHGGSPWSWWKKGGFLMWKPTFMNTAGIVNMSAAPHKMPVGKEQDACTRPGHARRDGGWG